MATVPVEITWTTGQVVTAAQLNANVRDAINFLLAPPLAVLKATVGQSLANIAFVGMLFDAEDIDRDNGHSTVTNTSRYTCQTPGWYHGDSGVFFGGNGVGRRLTHWAVNGSALAGDAAVPAVNSGGGGTGVVYSRPVFISVGDYVELAAFQDTGAALGCSPGSYMVLKWISN